MTCNAPAVANEQQKQQQATNEYRTANDERSEDERVKANEARTTTTQHSSDNEPTNQPNKQTTKQTTKQPTNQRNNKPTNKLHERTNNEQRTTNGRMDEQRTTNNERTN